MGQMGCALGPPTGVEQACKVEEGGLDRVHLGPGLMLRLLALRWRRVWVGWMGHALGPTGLVMRWRRVGWMRPRLVLRWIWMWRWDLGCGPT